MGTETFASCPKCLKLNKISLAKAKALSPVCGACGAAIDFHDGVLNASTQQLQKLIEKSPQPVIVDFWAPWCAPCRSFAPTFSRVAQEGAGQAVFVKVNTEENMHASQAFQVRGIPTIAVFRGGVEVDRLGGALPYEHFKHWVAQLPQSAAQAQR